MVSDQSRRIVILPVFCEAHILPFFLRNMCEVVEPDMVIMNEGPWPRGPEGNITTNKLSRWIKDGNRSFDLEAMISAVEEVEKEHREVAFSMNFMEYKPGLNTRTAQAHCYRFGLPPMKTNDILFLLGADELIHEDQKDLLNRLITRLRPDTGFIGESVRVFTSPKILLAGQRPGFPVLMWGSGELYRDVFTKDNFWLAEGSTVLKRKSRLRCFHYEWLRPGTYYDLRVAQLYRSPKKMRSFNATTAYIKEHHKLPPLGVTWPKLTEAPDDINFHPKHIHGHELFKGVYQCTQ